MYVPNISSVATRAPNGTGFYPLGTIGHVGKLVHADTMPGGNSTMSCLLQISGAVRHPAFNPGRICEIYRGGSKIWEGLLTEPVPGDDGWTISAKGAGTYGDQYLCNWTSWTINNPIDAAITRGLRWVKGTLSSTGMYLQEIQDTGSLSISAFLNLVTKPGGYTWKVGKRNQLTIFPIPVTPTRILFSSSPQARSLVDYVNALYGRYQATADTANAATFGQVSVTNPASITKHTRFEQQWDLSAAGVISSGTASGYLTTALSRYVNASWAGPLPVRHGQYTTMTGVPVDLGCEKAGEVVLLRLCDGPYGGEVSPSPPVTFPVGAFEYDEAAGTGAITPFQSVAGDLSTLLDALATSIPVPTPVSTP